MGLHTQPSILVSIYRMALRTKSGLANSLAERGDGHRAPIDLEIVYSVRTSGVLMCLLRTEYSVHTLKINSASLEPDARIPHALVARAEKYP